MSPSAAPSKTPVWPPRTAWRNPFDLCARGVRGKLWRRLKAKPKRLRREWFRLDRLAWMQQGTRRTRAEHPLRDGGIFGNVRADLRTQRA
jgi:hypothetical protein